MQNTLKKYGMAFFRWLSRQLVHALGWQCVGSLPPGLKQAVLVVAPHTSNWDAFYGLQFCLIHQLPIRFAIKKEALVFPLGPLLKWMGALPIDRQRKKGSTGQASMVTVMAELFQQHEALLLVIAPEGTRSRVTRWRQGFYHVAQQAQVPIVLGYIDYARKEMGIGPVVYPTGDWSQDVAQIQAFYRDKLGKYPVQGMG